MEREQDKLVRRGEGLIEFIGPTLPKRITLKCVVSAKGHAYPHITISMSHYVLGDLELKRLRLNSMITVSDLFDHIINEVSSKSIDHACERMGKAMMKMVRE
jgi:hypothetical protein